VSAVLLAADVVDAFERAKCRAPDAELITEHGLLIAFPDFDEERTVVAIDEDQSYTPYTSGEQWRAAKRKHPGEPGGRWSLAIAQDPDNYDVVVEDVFLWRTHVGPAIQNVIECILSIRIPDEVVQQIGAAWAHPDGDAVAPLRLQYAMEEFMSGTAGFDAQQLPITAHRTSQGMAGILVDGWITLEQVSATDARTGENGHGWVVSAPGWPSAAFWWLGGAVRLIARAVLWHRNNLDEVAMEDPGRAPPCVVTIPKKDERRQPQEPYGDEEGYEDVYGDDY